MLRVSFTFIVIAMLAGYTNTPTPPISSTFRTDVFEWQ